MGVTYEYPGLRCVPRNIWISGRLYNLILSGLLCIIVWNVIFRICFFTNYCRVKQRQYISLQIFHMFFGTPSFPPPLKQLVAPYSATCEYISLYTQAYNNRWTFTNYLFLTFFIKSWCLIIETYRYTYHTRG